MTDPAAARMPALVRQAYAAAQRVGFPVARDDPGHGRGSASLPGTGQFLATLAAGCTGGSIAELGRAQAAAAVLAGDSRVAVLAGDWTELLPPLGPFDLIFSDSGVRDTATFSALVSLLRPGGRIVMDDVTPVLVLPADSALRHKDIKREFFAGESRLVWTEVVLPDLANSLLVGTRK
jgi:SAM-dependent methyltransferase